MAQVAALFDEEGTVRIRLGDGGDAHPLEVDVAVSDDLVQVIAWWVYDRRRSLQSPPKLSFAALLAYEPVAVDFA
jgi:hypothetical protein